MAYRSSAPERTTERWDRSRFEYERDRERDRDRDRDRFEEIRERFEDDNDHVYVRRGGGGPPPPMRGEPMRGDERVHFRPRDRDRDEEYEDDILVRERERRRVVYDDEPLQTPLPMRPRRRSPSPFRGSGGGREEIERSKVVIEKERYRSPSPAPRRPARIVRRQSSLDTFDRPRRREEYEYVPPAARRGDNDFRVPPYVDIPLPRSRALPPPRVYAEREYYDEIQVSDRERFGDEEFRGFPPPAPLPERVREREVIRTRRRSRSRESRSTVRRSRRGRSRSNSSSSSTSSDDGGTTLTARSEYPKKGKTRIPARLVSKRALIDLGYPFVEEGKTIIVQKALGQQNIDDLLKLSDDYKKSELEIIAARSSAGDVIEERIEHRTEVYENAVPPPPIIHHHHHAPPPPPAQSIPAPGDTGPIIVSANPPPLSPASPLEVVKTTVVRDVSPARSYTTASYDSYDTYDSATTYYDDGHHHRHHHHHSGPVILDTYHPRDREMSGHVPVGPVALVGHPSHSRHHSRSRHRSSSRRSRSRGGELVRAERLSTGELVLYEEEVEQIQEPARGGVRIERDKRGRLSISVPRYR